MLWLRSLGIWVIIILAEILQGTARNFWLKPWIGDLPARQIGVFTGSATILIITIILIPWIQATRSIQLWGVGLFWLSLTLGFEILLGRFGFGYSWDRIFLDYNLVKGGLLPIGLLILTLSPWIATQVRREFTKVFSPQ